MKEKSCLMLPIFFTADAFFCSTRVKSTLAMLAGSATLAALATLCLIQVIQYANVSTTRLARIISSEYPNILGHPWCHETRVSTQWGCIFWLECRVSWQTKKFKMADKERMENMANAFQCDEYKSSGGINLSQIGSNIVEVMKNRKFVFAFHVTDKSLPIKFTLRPKKSTNLNLALQGKFDELRVCHSLKTETL